MQLEVNGGSPIEVSESIFACEYNQGLLHQVLTAYMAGGRQGSKAQKTRAEVSGGGKKPWKQKGTGNARAGTTRGPLWRGGGVTFAATPRDFSKKVNRKMYRKGMRIIFSELARQSRLHLIADLTLSAAKTKELASKLRALKLDDVLIVGNEASHDLYLAARNLPKVAVCNYTEVTPLNLLSYKNVLMTTQALEKLTQQLNEQSTQKVKVDDHE